ncbi:hypothetical protein [Chitinolyticbacter meiyuanensis]|uniref:hypothetical protein n=1 Tax=Chitinolyticbacter meiyuanensis TaxID=682798 RepID=UPI0011E5E685|nr:hypothetical protein [Chitinolyticbacter meiyuanensis]
MSIDALRALAQQSLARFSERNQSSSAFDLNGVAATASIDFRGAIAADLSHGLKKGKVLIISGRSEFEFQNELITNIS